MTRKTAGNSVWLNLKLMKFALLLIILNLIGCGATEPDPNTYPDFQYPIDGLKQRKVFIYKKLNSEENERGYKYKELISLNGTPALASVQGNGQIKYDSAITTASNQFRLLEIYLFDYDSLNTYLGLTQGDIQKDKISEDGFETQIKFEKDNIIMKTGNIQEFIRDTTFSWNGNTIPAVYFENQFQLKVSHKFIPFIGQDQEYPGYSIYAKGLGLVKYGTSVNGEMTEWELEEIN